MICEHLKFNCFIKFFPPIVSYPAIRISSILVNWCAYALLCVMDISCSNNGSYLFQEMYRKGDDIKKRDNFYFHSSDVGTETAIFAMNESKILNFIEYYVQGVNHIYAIIYCENMILLEC